jgi:PBP1b-binding outer membrane lipoprotein LpoB
MKRLSIVLLMLSIVLISGCVKGEPKPDTSVKVSDYINN